MNRYTFHVDNSGFLIPDDEYAWQSFCMMNRGKKVMIIAHNFEYDITRSQQNLIRGWIRLICKKTGEDNEDLLIRLLEPYHVEKETELTSKESHEILQELERIANFNEVNLYFPKGYQRRDFYDEVS
jgi:hypothetical protein